MENLATAKPFRRSILYSISLTALCIGLSNVSHAAISEMVVTSKVREQALSDVPLSVTAIDSLQLEKLGIESLQDLDQFAPSLDLRTPASRRDTTITMRGLSPNTVDERLRGVSVFVDGVYLSGSIASLQLQDLERVEVIRGPQSTLFGRATYSGAIDLITQSPKVDTISGRLQGSYSQFSVGDTPKFTAGMRVDLPLVQNKLWASVSASYNKTDSFAKTPSGFSDVGGEETQAYGITLYAEPTDNLSLKFRYNHSEDEDDQNFVHITHPDEWAAAGVATAPVGSSTIWPIGEVMDPIAGTTECEPTVGATLGSIGRGTPNECGMELSRDFFSLVAEYDMNGYTLSYHGGYYESDLDFNDDFFPRGASDGLGNDPFFGTIDPVGKLSFALIAGSEKFKNQSHQFRIISPADARLRWLAGAYYFNEKDTNFSTNNFTGAIDVLSRGAEKTKNIAVFGQVEYDLTDQFAVSLEARYQREEITLEECAPECTSTSLGTNIFGRSFEESENEFLPRVTFTWRPNDNNMFYALYAQGTKSARFNTRRPAGMTNDDYEERIYVEPEKLQSIEVGSKNTLFDDRLSLSTALFYQEVEDQQRTFQLPASTVAFTDNVAESKIWGFEIEAVAEITESLLGNIGIGYADHEFDSEFTAASSSDRRILNDRSTVGLTSIGIPKTTINGGLQYTMPLSGDMDLTLRGDVTHRSKQYVDIANQAYIPSSTKLNLLASVGTEDWQVGFFAKNVTEDKTSPGTFSGSSSCTYRPTITTPLQRCLGLSVSRGREIGVRASFNF